MEHTKKEEAIPQNIKNLINELSEQLFIVEDKSYSRKKYVNWRNSLYDIIKQGFEYRELRTCPVYFKFTNDDDKIHTMQLRHLITNLMLWEAVIQLMGPTEVLDDYYMFDASDITANNLYEYFDEKIIDNFKDRVSNKKLNRVLNDMVFELSKISTDFNIIMGITLNMRSFIDLAKQDKEFDELINTKIPENLQPAEIEDMLEEKKHKLINILKTKDNCLKPILESGTGLKDQQLREFFVNGGPKPDLLGNTMPVPINGNFVVGGLSNVTNYIIDAKGGRKAAVMSKGEMGNSGAFAATVIQLCTEVKFSHEDDCGTLYPIKIFIENAQILAKFVGRYYIEELNDSKYKLLTKHDRHLIGQYIYVRTPVTCACKDGICKTCYGALYDINKDLESPGALSAIKITMPVSQDILSSKHLLTTVSIKIEFNEEFYELFDIRSNYVIIDDNDDIDLSQYQLCIKEEDLCVLSEFDENEYNHYVKCFYVKDEVNDTLIKMEDLSGVDLYIDKDVFKSMRRKNKMRFIKLSKIDSDQLFVIEIKNNELTKPLKDIKSLLDTKKNPKRTNISSMIMEMNRLMIESRINLSSLHAEMIIHALVRKSDDIIHRPDFSRYGAADYTILTVKSAIENHPSPNMGISFQQLKRQLTKRLSTYEKESSCLLDHFYKK